jgi:hypothetical protein
MLRAHLLLLLVLAACSGAQDAFIGDRTSVSCNDAIPVCTTTAACELDGTNYAAGSFTQGTTLRAIVTTTGAAAIDTQLFFVNEGTPGTDTEISIFEAACTAQVNQDSGGTDIFRTAGDSRVWSATLNVDTAGDHLLEVFSDAQADYLVSVTITPLQ